MWEAPTCTSETNLQRDVPCAHLYCSCVTSARTGHEGPKGDRGGPRLMHLPLVVLLRDTPVCQWDSGLDGILGFLHKRQGRSSGLQVARTPVQS